MNAENNARLVAAFPELYKELWKGHIEAPDGWYSLLYNLSSVLALVQPTLAVKRMKCKFGGLRVYAPGTGLLAQWVIDLAEARSFSVCETCGHPGHNRQRLSGWLYTACADHVEVA